MKKRVFALFVTLTMCVTLLAGCGGAASSTAASPNAANGDTVLRFAIWNYATSVEYGKLIEAFEAENPGIKIEIVDVPASEYTDKMTVALAGGDDIDIIGVYSLSDYASYINKNQIMPLNDYVAKDNLDMTPFKGADKEIEVDGKLYALPYRSDFYVTYYNKDLFDAADMDYPTNDMTWEQYSEMAKELTTGEASDKVYGAYVHSWASLMQCWAPIGTELDRTVPDYAYFAPYYELFLKMQNEDKSIMDLATIKTSNAHYASQFETAKCAMTVNGSWFIGSLINDKKDGKHDVNWGAVRAPHMPEQKAGSSFMNVTPVAINAKTKNADAAWKFVKFIGGEKGSKIFAENGVLPAYLSDDVMDVYTKLEGMPEEVAAALDVTDTKIELPPVPKAAAIDQILNEEHELIMLGERSVEEGIATMEERVSAELGQ